MKVRRDRFTAWATALLILAAIALAGKGWLDAHPGDNPWAPLDLRDEPGWATPRKIAALKGDPAVCRAVLDRSAVAFETLPPQGEGACARPDRTLLGDAPFSPATPPTTCAVAAANTLWLEAVDRAASERLGSPLARVRHLGAYSCRRLYGRATGAWSEHATGNAIDIAGFVLEDGREISVLDDWSSSDPGTAAFLRAARDAACDTFSTVLSPDYNAAHRDHLHLDQGGRWGGVCR